MIVLRIKSKTVMMKYLSFLVFTVLLFNCNEKQTKVVDADDLIKQAIVAAGGSRLDTSTIAFDFRNVHYKAKRLSGKFELMRISMDSNHIITDHLDNKGFKRYFNDSLETVPDDMAAKYSASVNSVHYFSVLPYGLDDKAVNKTYLNDIEINGETYHKIKVTFNEIGGGEDFEDEFIYWINLATRKVDYLAYLYNEDDGKGFRFREAYNERFIKGIRFVDYNNYKPKDTSIQLEDMDDLFINDELILLSKIELENVRVN